MNTLFMHTLLIENNIITLLMHNNIIIFFTYTLFMQNIIMTYLCIRYLCKIT